MSKKRPLLLQFGQEIRRRRKALNLTLDKLAERAKLTPQYIGTIENGHRDPSLSTIESIAIALGISPGELFGPSPEFSPKFIELGNLFDRASPEFQKAVLLILLGASET